MRNIFETYFSRYKVFDAFITEPPDENLKTSVVIPAYNEPDLFPALNSLLNCTPQKFPAEILVVVNSKENETQDVLNQNAETVRQVKEIAQSNVRKDIKIFCLDVKNLPKKHAGAGFARKTGMDEAIRRFCAVNNPGGVIVSFDADSRCSENYLSEIENFFLKNPKAEGVSIRFEHDVEDKNFPLENRTAASKYELYMRYYVQALRFAGFPYAFQTVGSAFAVRASAYCEEGGMNRRQAGEDFYFLQKIIPRGKFFELDSAKVFPSIRFSSRVPFGTGVSLKQINSESYDVYCLDGFLVLKNFFGQSETAPILKKFLDTNGFYSALEEMKKNSASKKTFKKRFFTWFDAFRVLKFLNFAHSECFKKLPVETEAAALLDILKKDYDKNEISAKKLLKIYRGL